MVFANIFFNKLVKYEYYCNTRINIGKKILIESTNHQLKKYLKIIQFLIIKLHK